MPPSAVKAAISWEKNTCIPLLNRKDVSCCHPISSILSSAFGYYIVSPAWKHCTFTLSLCEQPVSLQDLYQPAQSADMFQTLSKFNSRDQLMSSQGWEDGTTMVGNT